MPEFFLELFSEEIPARMQRDAANGLYSLCDRVCHGLEPTDIKVFYGPRRIAVSAFVKPEKSGRIIVERGPRQSAPENAVTGFLGKHSASRDELAVENGYFWLRRYEKPTPAADAILQTLPATLSIFSWPKSMRWGQSGSFTWVRPLRHVVCLLDGHIVPFELGPITTGAETEGHRFLAPGRFAVISAADWEEKLKNRFVIADDQRRRTLIVDGLSARAAAFGLSLVEDSGLVDEVSGLVEWPVALIGKIDEDFMDLPVEVRELSMKINQRYFGLRDGDGKPAPYFAFVSNIEARDGGKTIIAGNERVLRARLSDARYFWDIDLATPLFDYLPKLERITFHAKLGTQRERADRIEALAAQIAVCLGADAEEVEYAAIAGRLCKADLVTGMVGEFPELQGIMGGYYAERAIRAPAGTVIGKAIKTHYLPKGPRDPVPTGAVSVSVALADKLDTLTKFFAAGEKPTGSGDPYALRRAALGVIRIILENELKLHLNELIESRADVFDFIIDRLTVKLRMEGQRFDVLDAVLTAGFDDDLLAIMQRVEAVSGFLSTPDGANLLTAYRRAANILRLEDAKDGPHKFDAVYRNYGSPEADDLRDALAANATISDFNAGSYRPVIAWLAKLRAPVDAFLDRVTINDRDPEIRRNHLRLLARLRDTMHQIADFSKIEV